MIIGTSCFPTKADAMKYYLLMGFSVSCVENKIKEREIHIGKPTLTATETCHLRKDHGGSLRWFIQTNNEANNERKI